MIVDTCQVIWKSTGKIVQIFPQWKVNDVFLSKIRNKKEYNCSYCPKSFNQRVAFNMHVRIHLGLKPHTCHECGKQFSRKMLLKQHHRTHVSWTFSEQFSHTRNNSWICLIFQERWKALQMHIFWMWKEICWQVQHDFTSPTPQWNQAICMQHLSEAIFEETSSRNAYELSYWYEFDNLMISWELILLLNFPKTGNKPYECLNGCGQRFTQSSNMRTHAKKCQFRMHSPKETVLSTE